MLYTCEHLEGKLAVWKHQVQAASIGATYSWTTAFAFHIALCGKHTCEHSQKHWQFWKVQAAMLLPMAAAYRWTSIGAFEKHCVLSTHVSIWKALAVLEAPRASCCHWSNIQLNFSTEAFEKQCVVSLSGNKMGKCSNGSSYVLNACTCLCTWIHANGFPTWLTCVLGHTVAVSRNFFLLECCGSSCMLPGQSQENQTKNTTQLAKAKWAKLGQDLSPIMQS